METEDDDNDSLEGECNEEVEVEGVRKEGVQKIRGMMKQIVKNRIRILIQMMKKRLQMMSQKTKRNKVGKQLVIKETKLMKSLRQIPKNRNKHRNYYQKSGN